MILNQNYVQNNWNHDQQWKSDLGFGYFDRSTVYVFNLQWWPRALFRRAINIADICSRSFLRTRRRTRSCAAVLPLEAENLSSQPATSKDEPPNPLFHNKRKTSGKYAMPMLCQSGVLVNWAFCAEATVRWCTLRAHPNCQTWACGPPKVHSRRRLMNMKRCGIKTFKLSRLPQMLQRDFTSFDRFGSHGRGYDKHLQSWHLLKHATY